MAWNGSVAPRRRGLPPLPIEPNRLLVVVAAVTAGLVLLGAIATVATRGDTDHQVRGTLSLYADAPTWMSTGDTCSGTGGYDDIDVGAGVVVRDGSGQLLGTSQLESGRYEAGACTFEFVVRDIPDADHYSVRVGSRGGLEYSHDEMVDNGWTVDASLGD
jgi:hypothetical protein